jgi:hypothetical protein
MNDKAYTLHLDPVRKREGRFKKGNIPWNKGMSWKEQGVSEETAKRKIEILQANSHKNGYSNKPAHSKPVIQMDEYGNRLHWYISSDAAAKKLGLHGRNIRKVCDGERKHTGGYRWAWDKNFLT